MILTDKIILTDCDGVILDWEYHFTKWMKLRGMVLWHENEYDIAKRYEIEKPQAKALVKMFNESAHVAFMKPLHDSVKYVRKLHEEHGFLFHCITSLSDDIHSHKLRQYNLENIFGKNIFERIICLPCGARKDKYLTEYYNNTEAYWIEDKVENAEDGVDAGLKSILYGHPYNAEYVGDIPRFCSWKEIYNHITGE